MAGKLNKSTKQILSVLFHLAVLGCMVLIYDVGTLLAKKIGWMGGSEKTGDSMALNFMEKEKKLSTEIDPELQKLVVKKDGGYLFRADTAFPPHLKVIGTDITRFQEVNMAKRVGDESQHVKLTARLENVMEYELAGKSVRFTQVKDENHRKPSHNELMAKLKASEEAVKAGGKPPEDPDLIIGPLVGKVVQFSLVGKTWKANPTKEFKTMAWGKSLEPTVAEILVENGLVPKPRWFGSKPLPIGHKLKLSGSSLDLVFENAAKGSIDMEFKAVEGVHGHPCAVFDVSGSIVLEADTDDEGRTRTGEETIESGRVWVSLLYPVVMRADLQKVVSYETREKGKLVEQFQGKTEAYVHNDWKAVAPKPKAPAKAPVKK